MNDEMIIKKIKELIREGLNLVAKLRSSTFNSYLNSDHIQEAKRWEGKSCNLLRLRFGENSIYFQDFNKEIKTIYDKTNKYSKENVSKSLAVLEYILDALENGLTEDLFYQKEILIFSNLLEQAYEFFEKGLREAAAIYGRIVLETTIKEFASKNGINEKSFDQAIIKLRQSQIIHQPFENSLRAQYQIGSDATHNNEDFKKYSDLEIKEYLNFIRDKVLTLQ